MIKSLIYTGDSVMIQFNTKLAAIALALPVSFTVWAGNNGNGAMQNNVMEHPVSCQLSADQFQQRTLSQEVIDDLLFMREEEKLARDVYRVLYRQWFANIFENISQSEQTHMDRVKVFITAYGLEDSAREEEGRFNDESLQALYDQLVGQGTVSELEAYKVGALVEEVDIEDLEIAIANTEIEELKAMYTQLLYASHEHLRAFSKKIVAIEGSYTAGVLTQEKVDEILSASKSSMPMGNANTIGGAEESTSNTCFISSLIVDQKILQNGSSIDLNQSVNIAYQVKVDSDDVGKIADWLLIASYAPMPNEPASWFVRNGEQWQTWDGQIANIPAAVNDSVLLSEQTIPVFEGILSEMPGKFTFHIGYQLDDDRLVYNQYPLVLFINP